LSPSSDRKARIDQLSPEKQALLQRLLASKAERGAEPPTIPRRPRKGPCPPSFCQQRLWFLDQLRPQTAAYNVAFGMRLEGSLDSEALARALESVVERHEVLRTIFTNLASNPVQLALSKWPPVLRVVDLRDRPADKREAEAQRMLAAEARRPFNLGRDVKLRGLLIRLADDQALFLHTAHHVAWDYRSRVILYQELEVLYTARRRGTDAALSELPIQYADFAVWQRRRLQGQRLEQLSAYWKEQLAGAPDRLEIPTDYPRPTVQSLRGDRLYFALPETLTVQAMTFSRQVGTTLFMTLLAAFKSFLFFLSGQTAISVGSPITGRDQAATEPLIGFFINTLVYHSRLTGTLTFRQLLAQVRTVTLGAYEHQEMPFEKLVEVLQPPRDLSRNPLFQVNFRVAQAAAPLLHLPDMIITPLGSVDTPTAKFDLALELGTGEGTQSYWEYSTDLFKPETIVWMNEAFEQVLRSALSQPDTPLELLPVRATLQEHRPPAPAAEGSSMPNRSLSQIRRQRSV
jgi:hypothetical protein